MIRQSTLSLWRPAALTVSLSASLAFSSLAADEKKPEPVKIQKVYRLPFFCVAEGLGADRPFRRLPEGEYVPGNPCNPKEKTPPKSSSPLHAVFVPPGNADDVATSLQPQPSPAAPGNATVTAAAAATGSATASASGAGAAPPNQFALTPTGDKRAEIIFCRSACPSLAAIEKAINELARPSFAYFQDYPIDSQTTGKALVAAVPVIKSALSAEVIDPSTLRVESAKPLSAADVAVFKTRLLRDQAALVAQANFGTPPSPEVQKDLDGLPADLQVIAVDLPFFCQSNDLKTPPAPAGKGGCKAPLRLVQANNFDAIVTAVNASAGKSTSKLNLTIDRGRILIACDTKCSGDALDIAKSTIAASARPSPLFAQDVEVPRRTAAIAVGALKPLNAIVLTDTWVRITSETAVADRDLSTALERVHQQGFGPAEAPLLQRMFYRSAGDVVGDLLSTPPPGTPATPGGDAATAPVTGNTSSAAAAPSAATTSSGGTTISITNNPAPTPAAAPAAPAPGPAPSGGVGQGMTAVDDTVVFTDTGSGSAVKQRARLLTLLDLPRPEVLMNMWSFQASSPDGKEMARSLQRARELVNANNDALQHAIDYGWGYLSRKMKDPRFFQPDFHDYLTKRFVADTEECEAGDPAAKGCLTPQQRALWGLCDAGRYCLGYEGAFEPVRPTLTSILLGMMAASDTSHVVLTTIGCMEGKFEVYGPDCFPNRQSLSEKPALKPVASAADSVDCLQKERAKFLSAKAGAGAMVAGDVASDSEPRIAEKVEPKTAKEKTDVLSCDMLDRAAVAAQRACGLTITLPLTCFTIQATKTFLPDSSFSTFPLQNLNSLAEVNLAALVDGLPPEADKYSATSVGLLRSSVADFLYNYKVAEQYPKEFATYSLPHTAQELNAQFNPLVVAFNQDVAALSWTLLDEIQNDVPNQDHFWQFLRHNKSYIANGLITVRGISGVESLVDTDTQSSFDATQAQTLNAVLNAITGGAGSSAATGSTNTNTNTNTNANTITINPDGTVAPTSSGSSPSGSSGGAGISCSNGAAAGSPLCAVANLFRGGTTATALATALAAVTPVKTHSIIGRQLTLDVIPHTLPGASSAELDLRLWAQEDSAPTLYPETGSSSTDYVSRVARHNVSTRVRVESVKLFDVSSFTALVQRPRAKLPILPPLIEIPLVGSLLSVPLPAAKVYYSSSAIVSAIIVPTAADLAYGLEFRSDRAVFRENRDFSHLNFSLRTLTSQYQIPETDSILAFHKAMVKCMASTKACSAIKFSDLPPER